MSITTLDEHVEKLKSAIWGFYRTELSSAGIPLPPVKKSAYQVL